MKPELLHSACHQSRATGLTLAIKNGHLPVVEFLWGRGAEQYLRDKASCLTAAISSGQLYMMEILLRRGADLYLKDMVFIAFFRSKYEMNNTFHRMEMVVICFVILTLCPKTFDLFYVTLIRLGHTFR